MANTGALLTQKHLKQKHAYRCRQPGLERPERQAAGAYGFNAGIGEPGSIASSSQSHFNATGDRIRVHLFLLTIKVGN
ncbi:MAG: hypothetical protein M1493_04625 [Firmicutes bacterium]|nr:hypothetical protein [Bacillota bacterium]